jgi:hypothetical protein
VRSSRPFAVAGALLGTTLILGGCYGTTKPATDIGFDRATLNGEGTTNDGPARVYFEYWPTGHPERKQPSLGKDIPAGVTGPISAPHSPFHVGLYADTSYTFRLCGRDQGSPDGLCAQTLTFRTKKPDGDFVSGFFLTEIGGSGHEGNVYAQSDPSGANPTGSFRLPDSGGNALNAHVTCVLVNGNEAIIGGVGTREDGSSASGLLKVRDDLTGEDDADNWVITPNGSAPDCASAASWNVGESFISIFTVYDTP